MVKDANEVSRRTARRGRRPALIIDRFWSNVAVAGPDECWPWKLSVDQSGYGAFNLHPGRIITVHRFAKILATAQDAPTNLAAVHTCKTPTSTRCCNPAHIVYRSPVAARVAPRGMDHYNARIPPDVIRVIRARARAGERCIDLADEFGVSRQYVSNLKNNDRRRTDARTTLGGPR